MKLILLSMRSIVRCDVSSHVLCTWLFVLLTLFGSAVTLYTQQTAVKQIANKRLDVTTQNVKNVKTHSVIECQVSCKQTSWCEAANLSPDRSTCQLLSEQASDLMPLESAEGWSYMYMRK